MESESDYGDDIQSPDEDDGDGEPKTNSNDGDEAMEVDEEEDEDEDEEDDAGNNVETNKGNIEEEEESNDNDDNAARDLENEDNSLGEQARSPSIAHSNISEEDEDATAVDATSRPEDAAGKSPPPQNKPRDSNGGVDEDSEDSDKGNNDEDKYSSYHSSPPESPSPPHSPDDAYDKGGGGGGEDDNANHASCGNRSPKQSLEDQDGELDFEEELPEGKEDCDSVGERSKAFDKSEGNKGAEMEENDGEEAEEGEERPEKKKQSEREADDADDDDGEVEDDDDLEEGEVKDGSAVRKVLQRPMCRFFAKGQCTWGTNCRFLHPGVNDKGNYNMFAPPKPLVPSNGPGMIGFGWHGGGPRISPPFHGRGFAEPVIPPPPPAFEEPAFESAWERGLRHAKEILKKSSKRKEMEPDFEDKRMNLSLGAGEASNEYEKENDYYSRSPYRSSTDPFDPYGYDEPALDPYERQAHDYWRGGNYENFEVRYTRTDYDYRDHDRLRERERIDRARERDREREQIFRERERERDPRSRRDKFERPQHSPERNWRDERYIDPQVPTRARGDEWRDPWRRSTSPKRRNLSRSFSSHSSASYSSSRSSGSGSSSYSSRSRSSSGSSHSSYSSRSYTHSRSSHSKPVKNKPFAPAPGQGSTGSNVGTAARKVKPQQQPQPEHLPPQGKVPRPSLEKRVAPTPAPPPVAPPVVPPPVVERKKVAEKPNQPKVPASRMRSLSSSGSESLSSRSRSRVEKSFDAWPQRKNRKSRSGSSVSRSSSISSLESVSSKSSISSKSSADSELEVIAREIPKKEDKPKKEKQKPKAVDPNWKSSFERIRPSKVDPQAAELHVKSLINSPRTSKDPLKQSGQKTQIKLTLLNKDKVLSTQSALTVRKDVPGGGGGDTRKTKQNPAVVQEKEAPKPAKAVPPPTAAMAGKKRPLQPSPKPEGQADATSNANKVSASSSSASRGSAATTASKPTAAALSASAAAAAAQLKKSTSSRREELLKQLKAVEDAIARKRAKLA